MKIFFNIILALIIFTTSMNAEEGHEGHDHGAHGGEGFYGHLELNILQIKLPAYHQTVNMRNFIHIHMLN